MAQMEQKKNNIPSLNACKKALYSPKSFLEVGGIRIYWTNIRHQLAYRRFENIDFHGRKNFALHKLRTDDVEKRYFDPLLNDHAFVVMAKRLLPPECVIYKKCMLCGEGGAPTIDADPAAMHARCFKICLGDDLKSADGYVPHFVKELIPRIMKTLPDIELNVFREIVCTSCDIFFIKMYDLKTKGEHYKKRNHDRALTYNHIMEDFKIERMASDKEYHAYIVNMMNHKHLWYSKNVKYSQITHEYWFNFVLLKEDK